MLRYKIIWQKYNENIIKSITKKGEFLNDNARSKGIFRWKDR